MSYIYNMTDTWNDSGTVFTSIKMNTTNTASAAGSKLIDLQVGGISEFSVDPSGNAVVAGNLTVTGAITASTALSVASGGTGVTTSTGSGANVLSTSPTLVTPVLGTPTSGTLTNCTGLPLTTGVTGTLPVASGGTGATTLTGVVIGNGTLAFTVKTNPSGAFVGDTDTQNLTNKTLTTGNEIQAGTLISDTGTIAATSPGFRGTPQVAITASRTLALADAGKQIYISGTASGQTITILANVDRAFPIGTQIELVNDSNQNWSVAVTTDTLLWSPSGGTGTRTLAASGQAVLRKVTSTRWWINGVGLT